MKRHLFLLTAAAVLALSCQTSDEAYAAPETQEISALYADYLAGSYAHQIEDKAARQDFFTEAFSSQPSDIRIGHRALVSAIEQGDMASAIELSERILKADKTESLPRAVLGVDAFRRGRESRALKYLSGKNDDKTSLILMQLVRGWVEIEDKDYKAARKTFEDLSESFNYFETYAKLQLAKLDALEGETEAALARLDEVDEVGISDVETLLTRSRILDKNGRQDEAIAALEAFLAENEGRSIGPVGGYLKQLQAGESLPSFNARSEAARAVTDPAFGFFAANRSIDGAELYLRFAHWIDPNYTKSVLWLGGLLEDQGEAGQQAAYDLYQNVDEDDLYFVSARLNTATIYFGRDEDEKAIKIIEQLDAREQSLLTRESLGRARYFRENYEEALPFYEDIVSSMTDEEIIENVEPLRFRGIIYERLKRWPEAEADFKRLLKLVPDDVETLNYLGYTWVDRGENLTEAFDMIRQAVEEEPRSGAIVDSLGWAHYKLGEYEDAKVNLEKAVALSPSSATIIDHLGDVYWKLGRKREAGFQWKRALEFEPTDEERETIDIKLVGGLEAVPLSAEALP